ncbi:EVE domain-containing protein [Deinococcus cellulosilyticus]|uniref:EVE domain-containing protein n=1 Tax=Deinococcus cellulosilyticus (strain DSM 18568 / NBRC 106333 / KACC 11606 / 5516J-15) TaxID=1223518 RepID=A0A511N2K5_DEIC1|nr:EVE domain-containing protein [Deinococcus cellulosilyticus]GEM47084.1 EVE domain-containing protein [Deinococcus cellulosilyticus NBRC 106333 = KACC 11606]
MAYWLLKSEPDVFGYQDLERVGKEPWNGVRNYQARNHLRAMQEGDLAFFYHSNSNPPGIAGICRIARSAYPDNLQFDPDSKYFDPKSTEDNPRWSMVDVVPVRPLPFLSLDTLRGLPELEDMPLLKKGTRLSVMPVTADEWQAILKHAGVEDADFLSAPAR